MLVLKRKVGEKIVIGNQVIITVLETAHQFARLGIDAPREVAVHREEVAQRIAASRDRSVHDDQ